MYSGDAVNKYERGASKLKVIGHPVRLQILDMLRQGELCVCHIERALGKRQAYISQQLMTLRDSGLVTTRKDGLQVYYRLADEELITLLQFLYGAVVSQSWTALEDCTCPACATVSVTEII